MNIPSSASVYHVQHGHTTYDGNDKRVDVSQYWSEGGSAVARLCVFLGEGYGEEPSVHSDNSSSLLESAVDTFSESTGVY